MKCRNCGGDIVWMDEYDEWAHGIEPLCLGTSMENLALAAAGSALYAEPEVTE